MTDEGTRFEDRHSEPRSTLAGHGDIAIGSRLAWAAQATGRLHARRACVLVSAALTVTGAAVLTIARTTAAVAAQADAASVSGSFTLSGALSGKIAVSGKACAASGSTPDVTFSWYGGIKGVKGLTSNAIVTMEVDLEKGPGYGHGGTLKKSADGNPPFLSFTSTNTGVIWQSVSGSYATKPRGASGSVDAVLHASQSTDGKLPGPVTIKGSWQGCPVAAGT